MRAPTPIESLSVRKTAEKYRQQGYEVSIGAPLDFMPGFHADVLARKDGDVKVIEVKSRSSLAATPEVVELADILDAKPGWSFTLHLVGEPERNNAPPGAQRFGGAEILQRIDDAQQLLDSGCSEPAFLLAWSACEAAIRKLIADEGVSDDRITTAGYVLDQATHLGLIEREDYFRLSDVVRYGNAIMHGFSHDGFGDELVVELLETARSLLAPGPTA